jgi:hypothetical protein
MQWSCRELHTRDATCDTAGLAVSVEGLQQAVASENGHRASWVRSSSSSRSATVGDATSVARQVLEDGGHKVTVVVETASRNDAGSKTAIGPESTNRPDRT